MTTASKSSSRRKSPAGTAKAAAKSSPRAASAKRSNKTATPEQRHHLIAEAAYLRAAARGFAPGDPVHDWLAAEQEVDARLTGGPDAALH